MITPPRSGGSGLTGKSGRKTANVCDASTREMNINTAANFMLVAFIKSIVFHHSSPRFAGPSSQNFSAYIDRPAARSPDRMFLWCCSSEVRTFFHYAL
jgi:hypothetical protein